MPLLTPDDLRRDGWRRTDDEPLTFRLDLPTRPLCWLELIEVAHGWRPWFVRWGMRERQPVVVNVTDLALLVSRVMAGKL